MTKLLSVDETTSYLHISRTLLWRLRQSGNFPSPIRLGQRRIAFDADAINAWLAEQAAPCAANGEA
jgi:predicted DNA-binding transcriptional regulator AlpA